MIYYFNDLAYVTTTGAAILAVIMYFVGLVLGFVLGVIGKRITRSIKNSDS